MSREDTDTNSQFKDDIPDGTYDFEVEKVIRKEISGKKAYEWDLDYKLEDGTDTSGRVLTWPSQIGPLLRLLGCTETEKGKFDWETELMAGKCFKATITHPTTKAGKVVCVMSDFQPSKQEETTPF